MSASVANLLIPVASATSPSPLVNDSSPDVVSSEEFTKRFDEALKQSVAAFAPIHVSPQPVSVTTEEAAQVRVDDESAIANVKIRLSDDVEVAGKVSVVSTSTDESIRVPRGPAFIGRPQFRTRQILDDVVRPSDEVKPSPESPTTVGATAAISGFTSHDAATVQRLAIFNGHAQQSQSVEDVQADVEDIATVDSDVQLQIVSDPPEQEVPQRDGRVQRSGSSRTETEQSAAVIRPFDIGPNIREQQFDVRPSIRPVDAEQSSQPLSELAGALVPSAPDVVPTGNSTNQLTQPVTGQVASIVAQELRLLREPGKSVRAISIQLDPPELGSLRINLRSTEDGLQVHVAAAEDVTLEMLTTRVPEIEHLLKLQDVDIQRVTIQRLETDARDSAAFSESSEGSRDQQSFDERQQEGDHRGRHGHGRGRTRADGSEIVSRRRSRNGIRA